jgi:hypothetical protein
MRNVTVIQCYALTEDADMEAEEAFYAQVNTTVRGVKKRCYHHHGQFKYKSRV